MGENGLLVICVVIGIVICVLAVANFIFWLQSFKTELRYLNKEIDRTTGSEQEHWKKRKKRLLLSLIPFVRY